MALSIPSRLLSSALVVGSLSAYAQQSADITVTGNIRPNACDLSLTSANVDYGAMAANTLSDSTVNQLSSQTLTGNLTCLAATTVALQVTDNNSASAVPANTPTITGAFADGSDAVNGTHTNAFYGLGNTSGNVPIGNFILALNSVVQSSVTLDMIGSQDSGSTWEENAPGNTGNNRLVTFATSGSNAPEPITDVALEFKVTAAIQSTTALNSGTDTIDLTGSATVTLVYL